ncbi:medium-chain acyl-CoA ligase ACSF2, mitochondrial-like [Diorhabda carinulata]|uniref:medium-chain acyl-CoA ligase ACSF2, mitochondrial-like n=1 Tax=Diorhabda carinulata TaxID=1163345 RepID=UPI0025A2B303|nr:medium-chain acyl-CoA ligase ACSF2, mitochondrial-like [Diorhabda carinulata]
MFSNFLKYNKPINMFIEAYRAWFMKRKLLYTIREYSKLSYLHNNGKEPLRALTLGQLLENTCKDFGDTISIISCHQDKRMTYNELLIEADRLAAGLGRLGFRKGDKIGLWAPNSVEWYVTFMACARAGFILVPLNPYYEKMEMEYSMKKVEMDALIAPNIFRKRNLYDIIRSICPDLSNESKKRINNPNLPSLKYVIMLGDNNLEGTYSYNDILNMADDNSISAVKKSQASIDTDDPCYIMFTSGTTGFPKAPVLSHFSAVNNAYFTGKRNHFGEKQHTLCISNPLFHAYGSVLGLVSCINYGTTAVLPSEKFDADKQLEAMKKHECTVVYGTPSMYVDLTNLQEIRNETFKLEIAVTGGAPCSPHLFKKIKSTLGVKKLKSIFGLTETTGSTFQSLSNDDDDRITNTVGYLLDHLEVKVVDAEGYIVTRGVPGELCIRGYSILSSYYKDEEKTRSQIDSAGWFHTGDIFIIDEQGYGKIVGRLKDMIIRGGENIYPKEIEDYLNTHPDIIDSQVIGLPHERFGEEICACLRTKDNKQLTREDLQRFCEGTVAPFKIPSIVKILNDFPKTGTGKVNKMELKKLYAN